MSKYTPKEVAAVIREQVAALNASLVYADGLNVRVGVDLGEDEDTGVTIVVIDNITQVYDL